MVSLFLSVPSVFFPHLFSSVLFHFSFHQSTSHYHSSLLLHFRTIYVSFIFLFDFPCFRLYKWSPPLNGNIPLTKYLAKFNGNLFCCHKPFQKSLTHLYRTSYFFSIASISSYKLPKYLKELTCSIVLPSMVTLIQTSFLLILISSVFSTVTFFLNTYPAPTIFCIIHITLPLIPSVLFIHSLSFPNTLHSSPRAVRTWTSECGHITLEYSFSRTTQRD